MLASSAACFASSTIPKSRQITLRLWVRSGCSKTPRHIAGALAPGHMDVTVDNFQQALPHVKQALQSCMFYAFDCEMTGLTHTYEGTSYFADLQERYSQQAAAAKDFLLCQFGLSTFSWTGSAWSAQTWNFNLFPRPFDHQERRYLCQAGSIAFLASQGFDFNKQIYKGIPFMPLSVRNRKLAEVQQERQSSNRIIPSKPEDAAFVRQLVADVTGWLAGSCETLRLPEVNSFLRALQYQQLETDQFGSADPPGFFVEKVKGVRGPQLQLIRALPERLQQLKEESLQQRIAIIHQAAGCSAIFELMQKSQKPAVGHNPSYDLCYILNSFAQQLPEDWAEYKEVVQECFSAGVWDTKHLAGQLQDVFNGATSLGDVHGRTAAHRGQLQLSAAGVPVAVEGSNPAVPSVLHAPGFDRYEATACDDRPSFAHEAGYDAFMTGASFATMLSMFGGASPGEQPTLDCIRSAIGRIHIGRSDLPYTALWAPDPEPERPNVLHVNGLPPNPDLRRTQQHLSDALGGVQLRMTARWQDATEHSSAALLELSGPAPDAAAVAEQLLQLQPAWQVLMWADYTQTPAYKAAKRPARRQRMGANVPELRFRKRQRPLADQQQPMDGVAGTPAAKRRKLSDLCSIM